MNPKHQRRLGAYLPCWALGLALFTGACAPMNGYPATFPVVSSGTASIAPTIELSAPAARGSDVNVEAWSQSLTLSELQALLASGRKPPKDGFDEVGTDQVDPVGPHIVRVLHSKDGPQTVRLVNNYVHDRPQGRRPSDGDFFFDLRCLSGRWVIHAYVLSFEGYSPRALELSIDGQTWSLRGLSVDRYLGEGTSQQGVWVPVDRETLAKVAGASRVTFTLQGELKRASATLDATNKSNIRSFLSFAGDTCAAE